MKIELEKSQNEFPQITLKVGQLVRVSFYLKDKLQVVETGVMSKRLEDDPRVVQYTIGDIRFPRLLSERIESPEGHKTVRWIILYLGSRVIVENIQLLNFVYEQKEREVIVAKESEPQSRIELSGEPFELDGEMSIFRFDINDDFYTLVKKFEIAMISNALIRTHGHQAKAARLVGLNSTTFNSKLKCYDLLKKDSTFTSNGVQVEVLV